MTPRPATIALLAPLAAVAPAAAAAAAAAAQERDSTRRDTTVVRLPAVEVIGSMLHAVARR